MFNFSTRNILSLIFFLIIIALLYIFYKEAEFNKSDRLSILFFGGIFLSSLFLFVLNFTGSNQSPKKNTAEKEPDENELEPEELKSNEAQIKIYTEGILININKPTELEEFGELLLKNFSKQFSIVQGIVFIKNKSLNKFQSTASYAFYSENKTTEFIEGDGISGQVAQNKQIKLITNISDGYITILSGLGSSSPQNLLIIPFVFNDETIAVIELAAFEEFPPCYQDVYKLINKPISEKFNALL